MNTEEIKIVRICENIGVAGTTKCHINQMQDGKYEARMGIAIMGSTNMNDRQFQEAEYNPFHEKFRDNYANGIGDTEELAITAMKDYMRSIANSLWY